MKDPLLINRYIPDHTDPDLKAVVKYTDIRTHHKTMTEIEEEPQIGIFYTFLVECPYCGEKGYMQEISNIVRKDPARKILCRKCKEPFNIREGQALFFAGEDSDAKEK